MCMQCAASAATAVGAASGIRVWLASRGGALLTPRRMRFVTIALLTAAVVVSGLGLGGAG